MAVNIRSNALLDKAYTENDLGITIGNFSADHERNVLLG
jgi:hypothetical protein